MWLNHVAERINRFRDEHTVRVVMRHLARGERVLMVAGSGHVVLQEPALRAAVTRQEG